MAKTKKVKKARATRARGASLERQAYETLAQAAEVLTAGFQRLCRDNGLSLLQYSVLSILNESEEKQLPTSALTDRMVGRVTDGTRLIDRLEASGYVSRTRTKEDRRIVLVKLTAKGSRLLEKLDGPFDALTKAQFSKLSKAQLQQLTTLLEGAISSGG